MRVGFVEVVKVLCFGSDEGDTVDSVLVVVVFYCQGMSCLFLWYDFIVFPYHQFQDRTFNLISFKRFHVFQHLSFFILSFSSFLVAFFSWLCFDLNVFRFASFFCGAFFMDFLDFVGGAQMRCARCFVCMEASLLRTYCVS